MELLSLVKAHATSPSGGRFLKKFLDASHACLKMLAQCSASSFCAPATSRKARPFSRHLAILAISWALATEQRSFAVFLEMESIYTPQETLPQCTLLLCAASTHKMDSAKHIWNLEKVPRCSNVVAEISLAKQYCRPHSPSFWPHGQP